MLEPEQLVAIKKEIEEPRTEAQLTKPIKRVRILFDDPYATDNSDNERVVMHNNVKRACVVRDLDDGAKSPNEPGLVHGKYRGVRQRRWGRWCAEIRVPMAGKRIWLGSYDTAEEASRAYERKRMELRALMKPVDVTSGKSLGNVVRRIRKPKMVKRFGNTDGEAYLETKEDPAPESANPVANSVWLGSYNSSEEASNAHQTERMEFESLTKSIDFLSEKIIEKPNACLSYDYRGHTLATVDFNSAEKRQGGLVTEKSRGVRILFDDPYATDNSDNERVVMHNNVKRACVARDLDDGVKSPKEPGLVHGKYRGVRQRKWGKWCAEIRVPMSGKRIWLGSYDTAEEASRAYEKKRMELGASMKPVNVASGKSLDNVVRRIRKPKMVKRFGNTDETSNDYQTKFVDLTNSDDISSDKMTSSQTYVESRPAIVTEKRKGVQLLPTGKWGAGIWNPIEYKKVWLGSYNTAEEASNAIQRKRMEFDALRVQKRRNGKWAIVIRDPISDKRVRLGQYNTAEEAFNAFQMKKLQVDALTNPVDFSSDRSANNVTQHIEKLKAIPDNSSASEQYCTTMKRMEFDALTKPIDFLYDKSIEKPKACLSNDSREHAFVLDSDTSPASDGQVMHRKLQHFVHEVFNVDERNEAPKSGNSVNNSNYRAKIPYRRKSSYICEESAPELLILLTQSA